MLFRRRALFLAGLLAAVSCSDAGNPLTPEGPRQPVPPDNALQLIQCVGQQGSSTLQCRDFVPSTGDASGLTTGGQNKYVIMKGFNVVFNSGTGVFEFDASVTNLIPQPLGTEDGTTPHVHGVRVFFYTEPVAQPAGVATVSNADGDSTYFSEEVPFFQYDGILDTNEESSQKHWRIDFTPGATSVTFQVAVAATVEHDYPGWVDITPEVDTIAPGETVDLNGVARTQVGRTTNVNQNITWSSNNPAVASVDPNTGVVTGHQAGTVTITAQNEETPPGPHAWPQITGTATIVVNSPVQAVTDSVDAVGGVTISYPVSLGLLQNDTDSDGHTLSVVNPGTVATAEGGTATLNADGSFLYLSAPGFDFDKDTIHYTVTDGVETDEGVAIINVGRAYWYVQPGSATAGTGTSASPFNSLGAADAASTGDQTIFVLGGGGAPAADAGIVLNPGQAIIGQGIGADSTVTLMGSLVVTLLDEGDRPTVRRSTAGSAITLATGNHVLGVRVESAAGAGISGSGFGSLTLDSLSVSATGGPALSLATGSVLPNGLVINELSSSGSSGTGMTLSGITGSFTVSGGTIQTAAGAAFSVSGGSVSVTYQGAITQGNNASLVSVSGTHTGTLTFSGATIQASAGDGLQFNDADGTYNFNGTTTLNGGNAGVDIFGDSDGTFNMGIGFSVTSPTAEAFVVNGGSAVVNMAGFVTQGSNAALLSVLGGHDGSMTFNGPGTLGASNGTGLQFSNADGTYAFNGTTNLNGGDAGIDVLAGSGGTFTFGSGVDVTSPAGAALFVSASAPKNLTFSGDIVTGPSAGRPVNITGVTGDAITVGGTINSTGQGILLQGNTGGSTTFSGTKGLSTGANAGVSLDTNGGHTVAFTNGNLDITTTTGTAFSATVSGTFTVTGSSNDFSTGAGAAISLANVTVGAGGMVLGTVSSTGSPNSVSLTNVTGTGAISATGGTLTGTAAGAPVAVSGGSADFAYPGSIGQTNNAALLSVSGGHSGDLDFTGALSASNGTGLQFDNADGTYDFTGTTTLNNTVAGGNAGIDITGTGGASTGSFTFDADVDITNPTGPAVFIDASAPASVSMAGDISTNAASGRPVHIEDMTAGTTSITFSGPITSNGQGILLQNNTSGTHTISFTSTRSLTTGANAAVTLDNNDAATISFGTAAMNINTSSGAGFRAVNGGTVNVTGTTNDVVSGTGTAVTVSGTTIGGSGVRFRAVSANGAANGIFLSNTGNTGGQFQVTGTGTAGSGGTIQNTSGADGATGGNAVYLENTRDVVLKRMQINTNPNHGIYGTGVTNFTLDSAVVNGTNGNSLSGTFNESAIHFESLAGVVLIRQNTISGGFLDNIYVANHTGSPSLNRLQLINNTLGGTINQDGARLTATVGTFNVTATGNTFQYWEGDAFDMLAQGTATGDLVFQNNTAHNGNASPVSGSTNIAVGGGAFTYNISNNSFRGAAGAAIAVDESGSIVGSVSGTIHNNQIGATGVVNSGSSQGSGIFVQQLGAGTSTTRISNNTIRQINGTQAILIQVSDASAGGGNGTLNATVVGNNIQEEGSLAATRTAMNFNIGTVAGDAHTACLQVGGSGAEENSITNFDTNRLRVQHRFNTTVRMPGYGGTAYDVTAVGNYLLPRNDIGGQALTNNSTSSGTGGGFQNTAGSAACPQPST